MKILAVYMKCSCGSVCLSFGKRYNEQTIVKLLCKNCHKIYEAKITKVKHGF